jgi:hypothetical protein
MVRQEHSLSIPTAIAVLVALSGPARAGDDKAPQVQIPNAGVPQIMTLEGPYIRAAYNNEGYVILGYRAANLSVGEPWLLIDVGLTLRQGDYKYTLKRADISLDVPDGQRLPLPSVAEYRKTDLRPLMQRANVQRDSIDYFPPNATQPCRLGFFAEATAPVTSFDESVLTAQRACLGRLFFEVPGNIKTGQYWLNVKFEKSMVRVPFRIFTKDEDQELKKHYRDIKKQVDEAFSPKG